MSHRCPRRRVPSVEHRSKRREVQPSFAAGSELRKKVAHAGVDVVADRAHGGDGLTGGVLQVPVAVSLAGDVWAFVAAAHGDDKISVLCELRRQAGGGSVGEVDPELVHDLNNFGVDVISWGGAGREGVVSTLGGLLEKRLAHLGAPGVLAADEEDSAHPAQSID